MALHIWRHTESDSEYDDVHRIKHEFVFSKSAFARGDFKFEYSFPPDNSIFSFRERLPTMERPAFVAILVHAAGVRILDKDEITMSQRHVHALATTL